MRIYKVDDLDGIDYSAFGVIAIKVIHVQQAIIANQQKQIDELTALVKITIKKQYNYENTIIITYYYELFQREYSIH